MQTFVPRTHGYEHHAKDQNVGICIKLQKMKKFISRKLAEKRKKFDHKKTHVHKETISSQKKEYYEEIVKN